MTDSPSAVLRATAERIQRGAISVPHGRWKWVVADNPARWQLVTNDTLVDIATCTENPDMPPSIAEHIASWDPTVALAVADLLDSVAATWEANGYGPDGGPVPADNKVLAICHAYNREVSR